MIAKANMLLAKAGNPPIRYAGLAQKGATTLFAELAQNTLKRILPVGTSSTTYLYLMTTDWSQLSSFRNSCAHVVLDQVQPLWAE